MEPYQKRSGSNSRESLAWAVFWAPLVKKTKELIDLVPFEQEWYYDDEAKVHYYEDGHYWFESRSVDMCQPIEDTPLGNTAIQFSMEIDVKSTGSRIRRVNFNLMWNVVVDLFKIISYHKLNKVDFLGSHLFFSLERMKLIVLVIVFAVFMGVPVCSKNHYDKIEID